MRRLKHGSSVELVTFSTDNLHLPSASDDDITIWNIPSSDIIARFPHNHSSPLPSPMQLFKFDLNATLLFDDTIDPHLLQITFSITSATILPKYIIMRTLEIF